MKFLAFFVLLLTFYMIAAGEDKIAIETALDKLILQFLKQNNPYVFFAKLTVY